MLILEEESLIVVPGHIEAQEVEEPILKTVLTGQFEHKLAIVFPILKIPILRMDKGRLDWSSSIFCEFYFRL